MATAREQRSRSYGDTRARAGDVTPDSQRERYEAQGEHKTTADYMDDEYQAGLAKGRSERPDTTPGPSSRGSSSGRGVTVSSPNLGPAPGVTVPMVAEVLIIAADSLVNEHRPPVPSRLLAVFGVFGVLGLARNTTWARPASAFAWALVLTTLYTSAKPGATPGGIQAITAIGDFMAGKYGTKAGTVIGGVKATPAGAPTTVKTSILTFPKGGPLTPAG